MIMDWTRNYMYQYTTCAYCSPRFARTGLRLNRRGLMAVPHERKKPGEKPAGMEVMRVEIFEPVACNPNPGTDASHMASASAEE
jgi:hypothetical protein